MMTHECLCDVQPLLFPPHTKEGSKNGWAITQSGAQTMTPPVFKITIACYNAAYNGAFFRAICKVNKHDG